MRKRTILRDFLNSERLSGLILIACSVISIILANTGAAEDYLAFWHRPLFGKSLEFWINDGLMTIFFLMVGLEIEREFYKGELSDIRKSLLPVLAAVGGMVVPALIYAMFNYGTATQSGFGIPMATDIAFSLAVLALLGNRVPLSLKIFLTALAIIDDLGAILVIAVFYSHGFSLADFSAAMGLFTLMILLNRLRFHVGAVYLLIGMVMWFFMYRSGIHATITGVLLAFALPFGSGDERSVSHRLQRRLHLPVGLLIVPLFALANTAIPLSGMSASKLLSDHALGIMTGLTFGKPLGIMLFSLGGIFLGICSLPEGFSRRDLLWTSCLAGIGFTMSVFITLLAFSDQETGNSAKVAIIIASLVSGMIGYSGLSRSLRRNRPQNDGGRLEAAGTG